MKKYYFIVMFLLVGSFLWGDAPLISNGSVTTETGRVIFQYDLTAGGDCKVTVLISGDDGINYNIYPTALTGEVGDRVSPGTEKQIIWRPGSDNMSVGDQYKAKIIARDNPLTPTNPLNAEEIESFVRITGGTFNNGTANVSISDFYMSKYEVTQGEYEAVIGVNPAHNYGVGSDYPVYYVSWFDAIKYCNIRSIQEWLTPCYNYNNEGTDPDEWSPGWNTNDNHENYNFDTTANGYRLPTEMEWMYAAKGGNQQPASGYNQWAGTNIEAQLTNYAWYGANLEPYGSPQWGTKVAGTKLPNQLGLYDMSGNVYEWCWDLEVNFTAHRVSRGGSWGNEAFPCRVAYRATVVPNSSNFLVGFRIARKKTNLAPQVVADPVISPEGGSYDQAQAITITCQTDDAEIYYTLDGSEPDQTAILYVDAFEIDDNITVKARAYKTGWDASAIVTEVYEISVIIIPEEFILVEGGTFNNGTANVSISDFYMSKYEVTQAEYEDVIATNPAHSYGVGNDYPVYYVSWFNAIKYCNIRSIREGLTPCYNYNNEGTNPYQWSLGWNSDANHTSYSFDTTANGYRLPTEMEWMYAAKGGNQQPATGYNQYAGTNQEEELPSYAWYDETSNSITHEVGTKFLNQLGLFDMSGNVWEWCWDILGDYSDSAQYDPIGSASGSSRVFRGGSWFSYASHCQVTIREGGRPSGGSGYRGFRLARRSQ